MRRYAQARTSMGTACTSKGTDEKVRFFFKISKALFLSFLFSIKNPKFYLFFIFYKKIQLYHILILFLLSESPKLLSYYSLWALELGLTVVLTNLQYTKVQLLIDFCLLASNINKTTKVTKVKAIMYYFFL